MRQYKLIFLFFCRFVGAFRLARYLTRKKYRILCYHGFSYDDEHQFHPKLFMQAETLALRLRYLQSANYPVLPLGTLLEEVSTTGIPDNSVAITIDDGWKGIYALAQPVFKRFEMPWMLYLTTYYAGKNVQVINIAIKYILWKTALKTIHMADFIPGDERDYHLTSRAVRNEVADCLYAYCDAFENVDHRQLFVNDLAEKLGLDWEECLDKGMFKLISAEECRALKNEQVDIQLHTHRHCLPETSQAEMTREIEENRASIQEICGINATHFCYPSGYYTQDHLQWLEQCNVISATTCQPGLNDSHTPVLELLRFLDGEHIHMLEFEAEVSGFKYLLQKLKRAG